MSASAKKVVQVSDHEDGRSARAAAMRASRRRALLDAALRVFADKGYHQTRIADILEGAGIARGTFYIYFESKNAIFHALLDELLSDLRARVIGVELGPDAPPLSEQMFLTVRRVVDAFRERPELTTMLMREAVGLDPEIDAKLEGFYSRIHDWLAVSIGNGRALGLLRADLDDDVVAWCVLGSFDRLVRVIIERDPDDATIDRMCRSFLDLHLAGVLR